MIYLITLIILVTVFALVLRNLQNSPTPARRKGYWRLGIAVTLILLIGLIVTGRMHWIGGLLGLLLPLGKMLFHTIAERTLKKTLASSDSRMTLSDALEILGVSPEATEDLINTAYDNLMQQLRKNEGGNDQLASRLTQARDKLLNELKKKDAN